MDTERSCVASKQNAPFSILQTLRIFTTEQKNKALDEINGEKKNRTSVCEPVILISIT